jgi:4-hydroxy-tetrahydrodipicolinate reductase
LEAACREGGVSLFATGSSPGFISEVVPITLLLLERSLRSYSIEEFANLSQRDSPQLLFDVMGFNRVPGPVDERRALHMRSSFGPSLQALAARVGIVIDRVEARTEVAVATRTVTIAAGDIEEGHIGGQRTTVSAMVGDEPRFSFHATWYCTDQLEPAWPLLDTGWRVTVDGDAPLQVDIAFPVGLDRLGEVTPGLTAHPAVNAVVPVCEARPGVLTVEDLGVVAPILA